MITIQDVLEGHHTRGGGGDDLPNPPPTVMPPEGCRFLPKK